jgi:hypothetical protein
LLSGKYEQVTMETILVYLVSVRTKILSLGMGADHYGLLLPLEKP